MAKATRVFSTPPTNTSVTRRNMIGAMATVGAAAIATAPAIAGLAEPDPIYAAIEAFRRAHALFFADTDDDIPDEIGYQYSAACRVMQRTRPTTPAGLAVLTTWAREQADWLHANFSGLNSEDYCALTTSIDDATRGMSGLEPWSPTMPAANAHPDAELIELGARFEPLVDRYYVARKRWARSLVAANAEHDREFGDPADRNYEYPPEIVAAFRESCERSGAREAGDALSAVHAQMEQLAKAINAASVNSIEGLRLKALVAFWEVAPLCADQAEFSFEDAYPFQQLFTAVAELCGLKDKMLATGYELPDIAMVDDDSDDEADDEGEEA
jgi:hypothetical protein